MVSVCIYIRKHTQTPKKSRLIEGGTGVDGHKVAVSPFFGGRGAAL